MFSNKGTKSVIGIVVRRPHLKTDVVWNNPRSEWLGFAARSSVRSYKGTLRGGFQAVNESLDLVGVQVPKNWEQNRSGNWEVSFLRNAMHEYNLAPIALTDLVPLFGFTHR